MLSLPTSETTDFAVHDGFLFRALSLCVPDYSLRIRLVFELQNIDHLGPDHSIALVKK